MDWCKDCYYSLDCWDRPRGKRCIDYSQATTQQLRDNANSLKRNKLALSRHITPEQQAEFDRIDALYREEEKRKRKE